MSSRSRSRSRARSSGSRPDDGDLSIGDRASTWIPEWKGTAANAVTVRDLLSNDSGRKWSIVTDYVQLLKAKDRTAFAIGLPQTSAPGTVWAYNNSAIQTLQPVVQQATGTEVTEFAAHRLLDPIGMTDSEMTKDSSGHAQMFEGLQSTCRDLARFGELFLNRGRWGAHQIVSSTWVAEATGRVFDEAQRGVRLPVVAQPLGRGRRPARRHRSCRRGEPDDHPRPARARSPGEHVLGARARQPGGAGRPGDEDGGGAARDRRDPTEAADVRSEGGGACRDRGRHRPGEVSVPTR